MNPHFIGAWWLGFAVIGIVILILAAMLFMYPKHMAGYPVERSVKPSHRMPHSGGILKTIKGDGNDLVNTFTETLKR